MTMGTGAFKFLFVVAAIAITGGVITSQAFDVPMMFGSSDNTNDSAEISVPDTTASDETPKNQTIPPEQPSGSTVTPDDAPQVVPVSTHVDITGMTEITGVTVIDVSGSYYIDGRTIAADSGAAIDVTADDVLIVIKDACTVTSDDSDAIRVSSTSKLTIQGYDIDSTLTVEGAKVNGAGSGIGNAAGNVGEIDITGLNGLTATGKGVHAYGIGGDNAAVVITDSHIISAVGGQLQTFEDTYLGVYIGSKGKTDTEGGPGIGGSDITISGTTIDLAVGGSKAAGIGVRFWQATSITITDSIITNVYGGAGSAGIGGSREVSGASAAEQTVTIIIADSSIRAYGGENGAGIGSGYDINCQKVQGECHIEITGTSVISATGGAYAAGIGTGFHQGNLTGFIESTVDISNVTSGEKNYQGKYSLAQDIGYGVVDSAREGKVIVDDGTHFTVAGEPVPSPFA